MPQIRRHFVLLAVCAAAMLAGCESDPAEESRGDSVSADDAVEETPVSEESEQTEEDGDEGWVDRWGEPVDEYPLDEFLLAEVGGHQGSDMIDEDERRRWEAQLLIADCMAEQGFEYIPVDDRAPRDSDQGETQALPQESVLGEEGFVARYGFGITTVDATAWQEQLPTDPNAALLEEMSDAERAAYDLALHGTGGLFRVDEGIPSGEEAEDRGCHGQARDRTQGAVTGGSLDEFQDMLEEIAAVWNRVENDPRLLEADRRYASCMADAGHEGFAQPGAAQTQVRRRLAALASEGGNRAGHAPEGERSDLEDHIGIEEGMVGEIAEVDPDGLRALREFELALAAADLECRMDRDETYGEVRREHEQRFVEDHREALERYRDARALADGDVS